MVIPLGTFLATTLLAFLAPQQGQGAPFGDDGFGRPPRTPDRQQPLREVDPPLAQPRTPGPDQDDVQVSTPDPSNQNEMFLSMDPTDRNHLIGGANDDRGADYTCAFYSSADAGQTWSELLFPVPPLFDAAGDPAGTIGPSGEVYFCSLAFDRGLAFSSLFVGRSFDGGITVPTWVEAVASPPGVFEDKQFMASDHTGGPLSGTLYVTWTRFGNGFAANPIFMSASFDDGATWSAPLRVSESNSCQGSSPAVGPNGELYVAFLDLNSSSIQVDRSFDGGMTWGIDVDVDTGISTIGSVPGSSFRANSFPGLAVDCSGGPHNGNLYCVWAESAGSHVDILLSRSTDGAVTWSTPQVVNDDGLARSQFFPAVSVDPNGNVNVGFYDRRDDPADRQVAYYLARSSDGGVTFQPNVNIADVTFNPNTYGDGFFIGDYTGVAASDRNVHALWADGRNNTNDTFTSRAQLDFHGDADSVSAASGGTVNLTVNPGPKYAGNGYMILGSAAETTPGLTFGGGVNLPLNLDALFWTTVFLANSPSFQNFRGTLDATGSAAAVFDTGGPFDPMFAGAHLDFATLVSAGGRFAWASNPYGVDLVP